MTIAFAWVLAVAPLVAADTGRVTYTTTTAAFVDQGSADGLAVGQKLDLVRKKRRVATCEVTSIAAHHAVCATDRAEAGDRFSFTNATTGAATKAATKGATNDATKDATKGATKGATKDGSKDATKAGPRGARAPDARVLEEQRAIVVNAPITKVRVARVRAASTPGWALRGEVLLRHQAWATLNAADASFQKPVLDAGVRANLGFLAGLQAGAALRLAGDALAPASTRFRADDDVELTVWEAGLFLDAPRAPWVASLGRFRPRRAPGAPLVDGALVAGRALEGSLEVGGYAGGLPDAVTLAPRFDRVAGGIYLAVDAPLSSDVVFLPRARIGVASTSDLARSRAELETQAQLCFADALVLGAGARVGVDGRTLLPTLDAAHASIENNPFDALSLRAGYRFISETSFDLDFVPGAAPARALTELRAIASAHHGDASATWQLAPWIAIGATGGVAALEDALRGWVGPTFVLPGVLVGGDLAVSHIEELGAFAGRSTAMQSTHWLGDARLLARISYFETTARQEPLREGAVLVGLDVPLFAWLTLQGRAQSVAALPPLDGHARATPISLVANAGLSAHF